MRLIVGNGPPKLIALRSRSTMRRGRLPIGLQMSGFAREKGECSASRVRDGGHEFVELPGGVSCTNSCHGIEASRPRRLDIRSRGGMLLP